MFKPVLQPENWYVIGATLGAAVSIMLFLWAQKPAAPTEE
jgi:hypothetical protein